MQRIFICSILKGLAKILLWIYNEFIKQKWKKMKYKVHRFEINMESDKDQLERFLNNVKGEVVSIIPNIAKTNLLQIYGVTKKIDFLYIVEKL